MTVRSRAGVETLLLDFGRPLLRVPNLAIHLNREISKEGLKLNAQQHLAPVIRLEGAPELRDLVATELRAQGISDFPTERVLAFDLMAYDTQASGLSGARAH